MTSVTLSAALQLAVLSSGANTYAEAHKLHAETGKPLVVLVGADWCPACQQMKNSVLPTVARRGVLKKVAFAHVNADRESKLARRLMRGSSVPQLIMYRKSGGAWKRFELVGAQSPEEIETFLSQGLKPDSTALGAN